MDHVVRFAPAHLEDVLDGFGSDGAQAPDEDDMLGFELWEEDWKEIT